MNCDEAVSPTLGGILSLSNPSSSEKSSVKLKVRIVNKKLSDCANLAHCSSGREVIVLDLQS